MAYAINNKKQRRAHRARAKVWSSEADALELSGGDKEKVKTFRTIAGMNARLGASKKTKRIGGAIGKLGKKPKQTRPRARS